MAQLQQKCRYANQRSNHPHRQLHRRQQGAGGGIGQHQQAVDGFLPGRAGVVAGFLGLGLDEALGDGDHGSNLARALAALSSQRSRLAELSLAAALAEVAEQGADEESDAALRARCKARWGELGYGATEAAYRFWASTASARFSAGC